MRARFINTLVFFLLFQAGHYTVAQEVQRPSNWAVMVKSSELMNLFKVSDDIYRSEQPDKDAFIELNKMGIKSVLNLRTTETDDEAIGKLPIKPYLVAMDAGGVSDKDIIAALKVIKSAPKPLLVHCRHGSDRTGVVVAMYRIVFQGWSKEDALNELLNGGFGFHEYYKNIPEYIKKVDVEKIKEGIK